MSLSIVISLSAHMILFCIYRWLYIVNVLTSSHKTADVFSVFPSTYSVICSGKNSLYLGKFKSRVWSIPRPFFGLPLLAKRFAGDEGVPHKFHGAVNIIANNLTGHTFIRFYCTLFTHNKFCQLCNIIIPNSWRVKESHLVI